MNEIMKILPDRIENIINRIPNSNLEYIQEIRLKTDAPLTITRDGHCKFLNSSACECSSNSAIKVFSADIEECFSRVCRFSVYSYEDELRNGFVTVRGGHRVGICGSAVIKNGKITGIKNISSLNIRIAREVTGCSDSIISRIINSDCIVNTLIISPPGGGKTTLLRDIARNLSIRNIKTCIVDERGELGAMNEGVSPFTLGYLCDVLDMYPKAEGIFQALRTLSPRVIILDEIGNLEESESILQGMNSGVGFILSAHGSSLEDIKNRIGIRKLIESKAISQLIVMNGLSEPCTFKEYINLFDNEKIRVNNMNLIRKDD